MKFICRYPFDNKRYEVKIVNPSGDFAHEKYPESKYAKDFVLPLGTPVLAVRRGFVNLAKYDSDIHYSSSEVKDLTMPEKRELANKYTNLVGINHKDGTFAEYAHLAKKEVVSEWQDVEEGEVIGYVGLSGITDFSHLHFNAFKIKNVKVISIPVKFRKIRI
jgi:murein DD-endopeptidase MepM/ murein hydrolase activator NlpD